MKIVSESGADSVNHEGKDYKVGKDGVFDVPDEVGAHLTQFPFWSVFTGEVKKVEKDIEDEVAKLRHDVDGLLAASKRSSRSS